MAAAILCRARADLRRSTSFNVEEKRDMGTQHGNQTWTPERDKQLKKFRAKGFSGSQIAARIGGGISRNAVIGRISRLGLSRPRTRISGWKTPRRTRELQTQSRKSPFIFGPGLSEMEIDPISIAPLADDPPPDSRVSLLNLTNETCRWPIGDLADPDFGFCGAKPLEGCPYCLAHARVAYGPTTQRRRKQNGGTAIDAATGAWR